MSTLRFAPSTLTSQIIHTQTEAEPERGRQDSLSLWEAPEGFSLPWWENLKMGFLRINNAPCWVINSRMWKQIHKGGTQTASSPWWDTKGGGLWLAAPKVFWLFLSFFLSFYSFTNSFGSRGTAPTLELVCSQVIHPTSHLIREYL